MGGSVLLHFECVYIHSYTFFQSGNNETFDFLS